MKGLKKFFKKTREMDEEENIRRENELKLMQGGGRVAELRSAGGGATARERMEEYEWVEEGEIEVEQVGEKKKELSGVHSLIFSHVKLIFVYFRE